MKHMIALTLNRGFAAAGMALALVLAGMATSARAEPTNTRFPPDLVSQVEDVVADVKKLLADKGATSIAVGAFSGPSRVPSSYGPGIAKLLGDELQKQQITVSKRAKFEIKGEYLAIEDQKSKQPIARLKARVYDSSGSSIIEFTKDLVALDTLAELFGLTIEPDPNFQKNQKQIIDTIDNPKAFIRGARIQAGAKSPYGIEILVRSGKNYVPRQAENQDGLAFVPLERSDVYGVRLSNDADHEVAVWLTIDGLNMFTFSDNKVFSKMILKPHSKATVRGWFRTTELSEAFVITEHAKSAAFEVGQTENIGTITAKFAACWAPGGSPPADEFPEVEATPGGQFEMKMAAPQTGTPDQGTGRGEQIKEKFTRTQRETGRTRAFISVHYNK